MPSAQGPIVLLDTGPKSGAYTVTSVEAIIGDQKKSPMVGEN